MSRKPETTFYTGVHKYLPPEREFHREKMYNPLAGGTWDFWFSGVRDLWVEYKFIELPKRDTTVIDVGGLLSALQRDWGERRFREGRNIAVIVGCKEGGVIFSGLHWNDPPMTTERFRQCIVSRKEIAEWLLEKVGTHESTTALHHK